MKNITLKVDSEGRINLPAELREELGNIVTLKRTSKGYLIISNKKFLEEFNKVITTPPRRTGKPELISPEKMKAIWEKKP
jgi:bifunctional DNA-binding transcriptional regulator/antitoxin component of YhaV-PrlF toxin-antitoxin module